MLCGTAPQLLKKENRCCLRRMTYCTCCRNWPVSINGRVRLTPRARLAASVTGDRGGQPSPRVIARCIPPTPTNPNWLSICIYFSLSPSKLAIAACLSKVTTRLCTNTIPGIMNGLAGMFRTGEPCSWMNAIIAFVISTGTPSTSSRAGPVSG